MGKEKTVIDREIFNPDKITPELLCKLNGLPKREEYMLDEILLAAIRFALRGDQHMEIETSDMYPQPSEDTITELMLRGFFVEKRGYPVNAWVIVWDRKWSWL